MYGIGDYRPSTGEGVLPILGSLATERQKEAFARPSEGTDYPVAYRVTLKY